MTLAEVDTGITLTIDGVEVTVPRGTLVIRAAEKAGVMIPRFCDHPLLEPVGACRQCLVDVPDAGNGRGFPKPQASCTLTVEPGMVVRTQATSPMAAKAQSGVMEFLLVNHPLDCPVCDKGGECPLQNQAMSNGRPDSRFSDPNNGGGVKRLYPKPIPLSPQVLLDRERCVLCARCTRFSEQISGDPLIELLERGALQQVGRYEDEPYFSYFSGNVIQICPVGALTSAEYRFRSRPFDLVSSPSVTEHDASGSAIRVDHRRGKVMRRLAGNNPEVNEEWITDKDRFAFTYDRLEDRLTQPLIRVDGALRPASWPEAFAAAAEGLVGGAAVLPGGRLTVEDAYAYSKFARIVLRTNDVDFRARRHSDEEADFLASRVAGGSAATDVTYARVAAAAHVVLVALEPEDEIGSLFLTLRKAVRGGTTAVTAIAPFATPGLSKLSATVVLTAPGREVAAVEALTLTKDSIVLMGERAVETPGLLSAICAITASSGASLAWIPRRAGDRGAIEAGALPGLLPGGRRVADKAAIADLKEHWGVVPAKAGRDLDRILAATAKGTVSALVVGGVDIADLPDPTSARIALSNAFVVSLEQRSSSVTDYADVVFPIAPVAQRAGTFINWEGRPCSFDAAITSSIAAVTDTRVLAGIAEALGKPLGFRTSAEAGRERQGLPVWIGERAEAPKVVAKSPSASTRLVLSSWKQLIDDGRMQDGADELRACARPPRAVIAPSLADKLGLAGGDLVTIAGPRGQVDLPVDIRDVAEKTVWVPASSPGISARLIIGPSGCPITVRAVQIVKAGRSGKGVRS